MAFISDKFHKEKLDKLNINIKTKYIVNDKILERNTDDSKNDDIKNGIICSKEYFINKELKHKETNFDSRIEYTFISKIEENKKYTCPNCGVTLKLSDFKDGCPYCRTNYNIDYTEKELGSKHHYDQILRNSKYRLITGIIDLLVSIILCFIFVKTTSRTFNSYDILKVFIYGSILSIILYYIFYIMDAYIVLYPIKKYKYKQNKKQIEFWNRTKIDKCKFFNNLNYEINKYYSNEENIIDYDIIDYLSFDDFGKDNNLYVKVTLEMRLIIYKNNKIYSKYKKETFILKKEKTKILELKDGANIINCPNCGKSIDAIKGCCDYCKTKIEPLQEWILEI